MKGEKTNKIKLLKLWELLSQNTDAEHPMGTPEILERLKEMGIDCDRRTLYDDIKTLNAYGYEIDCTRGASNEYSVDAGTFDLTELRILMDAVQAADFITDKKTRVLVDKIAQLAGSHRAEVLKQNIVAFNNTKSQNEHIYYAVNEIATAINEHKKLEFTYFNYNPEHERVYRKNTQGEIKLYVVNPYTTVFSDDKYYLVCYDDKHKTMTHYRVDRMERVRVLEDDITPNDKIKDFDIGSHKRQVFSMYTGERKRVVIEAEKSLTDVIFDKFGDIKITEKDDFIRFEAEVQVSPTFIAWCCSFGNRMRVVSPPTVVHSVKEHTLELYYLYSKFNKEEN
ncbi:MAG: WYL domain-containing transcriptional regulator [Clostridia bacterium]|nr:WYL domain-containing transcriptional regulator [Clostridia bacterium]